MGLDRVMKCHEDTVHTVDATQKHLCRCRAHAFFLFVRSGVPSTLMFVAVVNQKGSLRGSLQPRLPTERNLMLRMSASD